MVASLEGSTGRGVPPKETRPWRLTPAAIAGEATRAENAPRQRLTHHESVSRGGEEESQGTSHPGGVDGRASIDAVDDLDSRMVRERRPRSDRTHHRGVMRNHRELREGHSRPRQRHRDKTMGGRRWRGRRRRWWGPGAARGRGASVVAAVTLGEGKQTGKGNEANAIRGRDTKAKGGEDAAVVTVRGAVAARGRVSGRGGDGGHEGGRRHQSGWTGGMGGARGRGWRWVAHPHDLEVRTFNS